MQRLVIVVVVVVVVISTSFVERTIFTFSHIYATHTQRYFGVIIKEAHHFALHFCFLKHIGGRWDTLQVFFFSLGWLVWFRWKLAFNFTRNMNDFFYSSLFLQTLFGSVLIMDDKKKGEQRGFSQSGRSEVCDVMYAVTVISH
ncbi:hypothetical protein QBC46DRAFT_18649 [Diplogelasinospora grovesii]|uniref:Uncharacterized protein n=1 Tax=Diplogelasinospora grovesii TaxID=303347 RepID=A0AAN6N461_9PEZI|nr:hypothetical protein QBC46DRAFT_18649 [Diplogelasinospora grovesii]